MPPPLTPRQAAILDYAIGRILERGWYPPASEIAAALDCSASTVYVDCQILKALGYGRKRPYGAPVFEPIRRPDGSPFEAPRPVRRHAGAIA